MDSDPRLALSTSFLSGRADSGRALVNILEALEVTKVELEYRISEKAFFQAAPLLRAAGIDVVSLHNFCPHPARFAKLSPGGDLFSLSDTDQELRREAVRWTGRTIEAASDLEAGSVVLHCGRVDMAPETDRLHGFFHAGKIESDKARAFIQKKIAERDRKKEPHLDALLFSLDRLMGIAEKNGVALALENRFHYFELPGPEDFQPIFAEFAGAPLGYWHDTGHAHAAGLLTVATPEGLPPACSERLAGVHLHDARGLDDHLPPGSGEIDFDALFPVFPNDARLVVELGPGTPDKAVRQGLSFLAKRLAA